MTDQDKANERLLWALQERAKELGCLYDVEELLDDAERPLEEVFAGIIAAIPPGWQYPDICEAVIEYEGRKFGREGFVETPWKQGADIVVQDKKVGRINATTRGRCRRHAALPEGGARPSDIAERSATFCTASPERGERGTSASRLPRSVRRSGGSSSTCCVARTRISLCASRGRWRRTWRGAASRRRRRFSRRSVRIAEPRRGCSARSTSPASASRCPTPSSSRMRFSRWLRSACRVARSWTASSAGSMRTDRRSSCRRWQTCRPLPRRWPTQSGVTSTWCRKVRGSRRRRSTFCGSR
jgi:hypothetical protein